MRARDRDVHKLVLVKNKMQKTQNLNVDQPSSMCVCESLGINVLHNTARDNSSILSCIQISLLKCCVLEGEGKGEGELTNQNEMSKFQLESIISDHMLFLGWQFGLVVRCWSQST